MASIGIMSAPNSVNIGGLVQMWKGGICAERHVNTRARTHAAGYIVRTLYAEKCSE